MTYRVYHPCEHSTEQIFELGKITENPVVIYRFLSYTEYNSEREKRG